MDFATLATEITIFLTPFFPYLVGAGETAIKEMGKRFGEVVWEKAKSIWSKIQNPKLTGLATALAEDPQEQDFQVALAKLIAKQLEESPELATELVGMMRAEKPIQVILVEQRSKVEDILQRLSKTGKQEITVRGSQTGSITQEQ